MIVCNDNGNLESMITIVHELGHMLSYYDLNKDYQKQIEAANYERDLARGELIGFKIDQGFAPPTFDYTNKERFIELENIRITFEKFFDSTWEEAKKKIRKDIFGRKYK